MKNNNLYLLFLDETRNSDLPNIDEPTISQELTKLTPKKRSVSPSSNRFQVTQTNNHAYGKKNCGSENIMNQFVVRTSQHDKKQLDLQVARFIFATNTSFRSVENTEFVKLVNLLRPGYIPPNRFKVGNELLNEVYDQVSVNTKAGLAGKTVCMALDGWSSVHNESIICICVTEMTEGCVYLLETIDTLDNSHTWDYLVSITEKAILSCEQFGCVVSSVVTDNAANMSKMRRNLVMCEKLQKNQIITYGCSAHLLNLLAHDIEAPGIKSHIKTIFKYFRNSHFFGAKYRMEGGKTLVMPQDVRWNTLADTIQCYLDN